MTLVAIVRTQVATSIIEYLNTYQDEGVQYNFTEPGYFDTREVSVFFIEGKNEDIAVIKSFFNHAYESSSVLALYFMPRKVGIDERDPQLQGSVLSSVLS